MGLCVARSVFSSVTESEGQGNPDVTARTDPALDRWASLRSAVCRSQIGIPRLLINHSAVVLFCQCTVRELCRRLLCDSVRSVSDFRSASNVLSVRCVQSWRGISSNRLHVELFPGPDFQGDSGSDISPTAFASAFLRRVSSTAAADRGREAVSWPGALIRR